MCAPMAARCQCPCGADLSVEADKGKAGAIVRCACGLAYKVELDNGEPWLAPWKPGAD